MRKYYLYYIYFILYSTEPAERSTGPILEERAVGRAHMSTRAAFLSPLHLPQEIFYLSILYVLL